MKFRTELEIKDAPRNLSPERLAVLAGSCFSDNIGTKMQVSGWPAIVNPCGVIYNPVSMALLFRLALTHRSIRRDIIAQSVTDREGKFVSWFMSSVASGDTPEECVDAVCEAVDRLESGIEKCDVLILTFGTSDVWLLEGSDCAVGNCHKHPASEFQRRRVGIDEAVELWKGLIADLRERNTEMKVILTVSPRRYLSQGFADGTRQKAVLILICEKLCAEVENCTYFPAYEILNDDLRDYRFYASDLLHPSEQAIEYIWDKFCETYLSVADIRQLKNNEKASRRQGHRAVLESY